MTKSYEPDSQYLDKLEWQLASEYRRASRLTPAPRKIAVSRRIAAGALMAGILLTGVAVITATEYIRDSWRKKIEIARAETDVMLNKAHLASAREMTARSEKQFSDGLIREEEYLVMKQAADKAKLMLEESQLNLDEVKVSGEVPRNELYAPVIGGRDFVSERLEKAMKAAVTELEVLVRRSERLQELVANGLIHGEEPAQVQGDIASRESIITKIRKQLDLRKLFLAGELTARQVEIRNRTTAAEGNLALAESRAKILKAQMKRAKTLASRGLITQTEVSQLRYAVAAAQAELKLAALEMDILEKQQRH